MRLGAVRAGETELGRRVTRRLLFGRDDADLATVRLVQNLLEETPYPVAMAFSATFLDHDETASLEVLPPGAGDRGDGHPRPAHPAAHGRRIAEQIGANAELVVVVPGAGHSVDLTGADVVDRALLDLLERVEGGLREAG